jgi:hypothetical protein
MSKFTAVLKRILLRYLLFNSAYKKNPMVDKFCCIFVVFSTRNCDLRFKCENIRHLVNTDVLCVEIGNKMLTIYLMHT